MCIRDSLGARVGPDDGDDLVVDRAHLDVIEVVPHRQGGLGGGGALVDVGRLLRGPDLVGLDVAGLLLPRAEHLAATRAPVVAAPVLVGGGPVRAAADRQASAVPAE
eukprot:6717994-Alexandrium_andersonii.AAC.1